jgi:pimeloyl-ACP methyl ester carboxylesterase
MKAVLHTVGNTRINVIDEGVGDPVVFLHSNTFSWRNWIPQLDALSDRWRCIALDLRGYGSSDRTQPLGIEQYAHDVAETCATLGIERTHVVGISLGGVVAQALAIHHPTLVHGLVLANTTTGSDPTVADRLRQVAATIRDSGLESVLAGSFEASFSARFRAQHPDQVRALRREFGSTDPLVVAATIESLAGYDHAPKLSSIASPTLVIHGEEDALMGPQNSEFLAATIPGARLVVLDGAGHLSNIEVPDAFNRELVSFLTALARAEAG